MRTRYNRPPKTYKQWFICLALLIFFLFIFIYNSRSISTATTTSNTPHVSLSSMDYALHPVQEQPWGHIYAPSRIWCLVPSLYPRNAMNMHAISQTWGRHCTKLVFVLDDKLALPDEFIEQLNQYANNVQILQLDNLNFIQSSVQRNIWEKIHKMWYYIYQHHINDAEWFLKIDDDTFFSAITFRGMVQYFNPDNTSYYIGHTLLHEWQRRNIVFNAGACYGLSRGVLRKFATEILSLSSFQNDIQRNHDVWYTYEEYPYEEESKKRIKWEWRNYCVGNRQFAQEDPTMGICLRSIGINPINSLDREFRQRFHIFRPGDLGKIPWEDTWFWRYKDKRIGDGEKCCSDTSISFHSYKVDRSDTLEQFRKLDEKYNVDNINRKFEIPWDDPPTLFLWDKEGSPEHDQYFNYKHPPPGQRIYKGPNHTRVCHKCDWFRIKQ